jgi:hypothetical protein
MEYIVSSQNKNHRMKIEYTEHCSRQLPLSIPHQDIENLRGS